ncbi:MAG: cytochrome c3 family protein [Bacteroidales bacterium]|jgi:hypothetical protein|nr:cytochrome c3 family protein [Bacteroidales bacterium]
MKLNTARIALLAGAVLLNVSAASGHFRFRSDTTAVQDTTKYVSPYAEQNESCLKCHGQARYEYTNESLGRQVKAMMCSERIVRRDEYYNSNHKSFSCTDCHSFEYEKFPHPGELRMEQKLNCLDCHGGDETYARYHFEAIDTAYRESVHFKLEEEGFSCWKCHDPHSYKINIRNNENLREAIRYDNAICLKCHSNYDQFQLLSDREEINILNTHSWLPNQASHFASVRCLECHTKVDERMPVAHLIQTKDKAVKLCNECHSQNSILMASLYKFQSKEQRRDGFFNGVIMNESYVIGANRNEYLNNLSLLIFLGTLGVIGVHVFFRLKKKVTHKSDKEE